MSIVMLSTIGCQKSRHDQQKYDWSGTSWEGCTGPKQKSFHCPLILFTAVSKQCLLGEYTILLSCLQSAITEPSDLRLRSLGSEYLGLNYSSCTYNETSVL